MGDALRLNIRDLVVTSSSGRHLLEVPALDLEPGSCLGIAGPSGAGKSTLLFAIAGLLDRVSGHIGWGETEFNQLPRARRTAFRAAHMGFVFQDFMLFEELSAIGNAGISACFAPPAARAALRGRASKGLGQLGINEKERRVDSFSGGERQRVAIARSLASDPAILLADEPTASLHRVAADTVLDDMIGLVRTAGTTLIAVSHDPGLLDRMDRVITLRDGRLTNLREAA